MLKGYATTGSLILLAVARPFSAAASPLLGPQPPRPPQSLQEPHELRNSHGIVDSEKYLYPKITSSRCEPRDCSTSSLTSPAQSLPRNHRSHHGHHGSTVAPTSQPQPQSISEVSRNTAGNPELLEADQNGNGSGTQSNSLNILYASIEPEVSRTTFYAYDTNVQLTSALHATLQSVQPFDDSAKAPMHPLKLLSTAHPSSILPIVLGILLPALAGALVVLYLLYRHRQARRELPGSVRLPESTSNDEFLTESGRSETRLSSTSGLGICMQGMERNWGTESGSQPALASLGSFHSFGSHSFGSHSSDLYESSNLGDEHGDQQRDFGGTLRPDGYGVVGSEATPQHEAGPTPPPKDLDRPAYFEAPGPWKKNAYFPSRNELLGFVFPPTAVAVQRDLLVSGKIDPQECISPLDMVPPSSLSSHSLPTINPSSTWMLSSSSSDMASSGSSRMITPSTSNTIAPPSSSNMMASSTFGVLPPSTSSSRNLTGTRPLDLQRKVVKVSSKPFTLKTQLVPKKRFSPLGEVLYSTGGGNEDSEDPLDPVQEETNETCEENEASDSKMKPVPPPPESPLSSQPNQFLEPPRTPQQSKPLWAGYKGGNGMYASGLLNEQTPLASSNSYTSHSPERLRRRSSPMISQGPYSPRSPLSSCSPRLPVDHKANQSGDSPDQGTPRKMARASVASPTIAGIGLTFRSPIAKRRKSTEEDDRGFAQFVRGLYEKQVLKKGTKGAIGPIGDNGVGHREPITTIKEVEEVNEVVGEGEDDVDVDVNLAEELGIDVDVYMQMGMDDSTTKDADQYKIVEIGKDVNVNRGNITNKDADMRAITDETLKTVKDSYRQTNQGMMMLLPPPSFGVDLNELVISYSANISNSATSGGSDSSAHGDQGGQEQSDYGDYIVDGDLMVSTPPLSAESIGIAI